MSIRFLAIFIVLAANSVRAEVGAFEQSADVGNVKLPGKAEYDKTKDAYRITASGENIWGKADAFHFVYRKAAGDVALSADLEFVGEGKNAHRKAGLMIRQTLDADSPYVDVMVHGDGLVSLQYRAEKGGETKEEKATKVTVTVRLERVGKKFTLYAKVKDGDYRAMASVELAIEMPLIGLAVCSHEAEVSETAVFTNVKVIEPDKAKDRPAKLIEQLRAAQDKCAEMPDWMFFKRLEEWVASHPDDHEARYWWWYIARSRPGPAEERMQIVKLLQSAAEAGYARAQASWAEMLYGGDGVNADVVKAREWNDRAMKANEPYAFNLAGKILMQGEPSAHDIDKAADYFAKSIELGYVRGWRALGIVRVRQGNQKRGFECYKFGADAGDSLAYLALSHAYRDGIGTDVDHDKEFYWAAKAAKARETHGYRALAECYQRGHGVEQDHKKAYYYFLLAAHRGEPDSEYWVYQYMLDGTGTDQDIVRGRDGMMKLATNGNSYAKFALGLAYLQGTWVARDEVEARAWLEKAADQGSEEAKEIMKKLDE